jgi:putative membrane protein
MERYCLILIATGLLFSSCNEAGRGNDNNGNEAADEANAEKFKGKKQRDADFVYEVVQSCYGEIKLAELGNQKSRNAEVQNIARMLLTDHTASLNDLKTVAQAKAISVPVQEADGSRRTLEDLADESDDDFEKAWCKEMMGLHEKNINRFEDRLKESEDEELKRYIIKTLPVLKKHHGELKKCHEKLNNTK